MEYFKNVDKAMRKGLAAFVQYRIKVHKKAYQQDVLKLNPELRHKTEQEFSELITLLGDDHKNLLIDYTDHLNQKYFGMDRWYYEQGVMDCQNLYKNLWKGMANCQILKEEND